jgi:excisionase family DNA binding protein
MSRWVSTGVIAHLWQITPHRAAAWAESGLIRARRTRGGHWRIDSQQERPLSMTEVAAVCGVNRRTALRWAEQGKIPAVRNANGTWHLLDGSALWSMMKCADD